MQRDLENSRGKPDALLWRTDGPAESGPLRAAGGRRDPALVLAPAHGDKAAVGPGVCVKTGIAQNVCAISGFQVESSSP